MIMIRLSRILDGGSAPAVVLDSHPNAIVWSTPVPPLLCPRAAGTGEHSFG